MNTDKLYVRVQYLEQKITQLLDSYKKQQELVQQLQKENKLLMQQIAKKTEPTPTHEFLNDLEMTPNTAKESKLRDGEARLDSYISDIDRIITYLERIP